MTVYTSDSNEYLYTPGALGVTDEILVAAINKLGPGSEVHTSVFTPSSDELGIVMHYYIEKTLIPISASNITLSLTVFLS